MSIIPLQKLLESTVDGPLEQLLRKADMADRMTTALKGALDAGLASHLVAANLRSDGRLVVIADSPAWAARLRFESDRLIGTAREGGAQVTAFKVIVARDNAGRAVDPDPGSAKG
jgi:hypothetical protein